MAKNHFIKFRVTEQERERILNNARMNGHLTISSYLRNLALSINLIAKIYDIVKKIENGTRIKN